jgi:hypothetical protein
LLQSGTDVTVIRDYLGHASVATTGRYITTNLKMKRDALQTFWKHAGLEPAGRGSPRPTCSPSCNHSDRSGFIPSRNRRINAINRCIRPGTPHKTVLVIMRLMSIST